MVQQTPINNSLPYRRQSSLGGNKVMRFGSPTDDNMALLWGTVTQVYYRKGTVDFSIAGMPAIVDNSGSDGTFSAPIPMDFYGVDNNGKPFAKTRLIQKGNKVLVAFVNGSASNPVILGVYPDSAESYELISPSLSNTVDGTTQDDIEQTMNQIEVDPHHQLIYKAGNGDLAKTMQGHSFLLVSGTDKFALSDIQRTYKDIGYFYGNFGDSDDNTQSGLIDSNTPQAPEWLLVHENNTSADGTLDTHLTRFYVNHKGDVQVVLADTKDQKNLVVLQGNKTNGFTLMKSFDGNTDDSSDYVKFNVGSDHTITLSSATEKDSKLQSQTLEISSEDILVNGKSITSIGGGTGTTITDDHIKDIINETTGVPDWDAFNDHLENVSQTVQTALNNANQAVSEARDAAEKAQQAGEDAQLAGTNAANSVDDLKKHLVYYMSISPEKDVYVPGKYLILNEDVTVKNGFVKEAYIDDGVISTAKIKDAAITNAKIADLAVHTAQIADGAITNAKIGNLAVDTAQIADGAIIDAKVGHLTFNHMEGELLDASKIRVSNLQGDSIEAGTIKADKLIINNLSEISGNLGNITSGNIDAGQGNVTIDNLPADDPSMLTPDKKVKLQNTVNTLRQAVNAQNDFQNSIGAPSNTCDMLNSKMDKLSSDTLPLFRDMDSTEEYDYELINNDIEEVNAELNTLSNTAITTIGKTADGKNTIYTGAFAPSNPKIGDIWAKPSSDGSNEGTFEIYGENGWFSPTQDVYDRLQSDLSKQPKNYYQSGEPSGDIVEGSMWYKTSVDSLNNVSFDMYVYQDGKWVAYNDNAIEGLDAKIDKVAATAGGKNSIYSSKTAPANPKENDIWIDTGNDNTIKVYIDGQWVSPNQNTDKVQQEIDNAFSKVPQVYYSSNQPTGNIVEGSTWYKTGDNNTYTMYTYKNGQWVGLLDNNINTAVTDATNSINNTINSNVNNINNSINGVKDDINNLNFGGRNLLRKSQARDDNNLYIVSGTKQSDTFLGANVYEQHGIWQGQRFKVSDLVSRNVINTTDTYVFSTYVKITGSNLKNYTYFFNGDNTITKLDTDSNSVANVQPNVWTQISMPIKFKSLTPPSSNKFYIGWEFRKGNYDGNVYWACPKLEKGTKATDYSIAPEDTQDSLDSVDSKLNDIKAVNHIYNSTFLTDKTNNIASIGATPFAWHTFNNATIKVSNWGGHPAWFNVVAGSNKDPNNLPYITSEPYPCVTSSHKVRINFSACVYLSGDANPPKFYIDIADDSNFSTNVETHELSLSSSSLSGWNSLTPLLNVRIDGGTNWIRWVRFRVAEPTATATQAIIVTEPFLYVTDKDIDTMPAFVPDNINDFYNMNTNETGVFKDTSYRGVTISDDTGIKVQSGNNLISLNSDVGIDIYGNGTHNMSLDTNGNLVMRGNLVAGNISGVNIGGVTFKGNDMNLTNVLNVNGAIKSNGVTIDKAGLHLSDGDIALGASGSLIGCPPNVVRGWIQSDGSWASPQSTHDNGYKMLSINGGDTLTFTVGQVPDIRRNEIAFYDTNRSLVQYKRNNNFGTSHSITLTAPSNAKYVSFSFYTGEGKASPNFPIYIYKASSTTTLLMSDGTMIANNAILSGSLTSNNVNITGGSINLVKPNGSVAFSVDSSGNAAFSGNLSGVNITGNNSTLQGTLSVYGTLSAAGGNVIMNNDGLTINRGSINIGNGNGTTFSVQPNGTLLANNATITGDLTAKKLTIASNADVSINVNGQFTVDRNGNVYAGSLTLKNGTINSSNMYGSSIIGSTLKLADTYWNEFYSTNLSRTQYDEYGLRSGYTLNGVYINRHGVITHAAGVRERSMNYLAIQLYGQGWLDSRGNVHSSTTDIHTPQIQPLLAFNDVLHIRFTNGASNVFTNKGTRRIIFYDNNNNVINSYESSSNIIDITPPSNTCGFKLCAYVGNGGYSKWSDATKYGNFTNTHGYTGTEDSVIAWQGSSNNPGYDICSFNFGTTNASQLNTTRDNMWITALQLDSSQLSDGDIIKLEMQINYDNPYYKHGSQFWLSVNGKSMQDSSPYFGSTNLKYAIVGNYTYVWYFTYHSDLGNHIIINLNMQGMQSGSRFYITDSKEVLHSTRNPNYYGSVNTNEGAMNVITQDGKIRQTYNVYQASGNDVRSRTRDVQQHNGYFTLQAQSRSYNTNNNTINNNYDDFSAIYMSGNGLSFVGDFNKHYTEPFMYSGSLVSSEDNSTQGGAAITFWGNISHEKLLEHNFQWELGSGLVIDIWGNLHLMYSSVSWKVYNTLGIPMLDLNQENNNILVGNMFGANVPGTSPSDYYTGKHHIFNFEGDNGHITIGRMWMSTFGTEAQKNGDADFHIVKDKGWFRFFSGVASSDSTFHTISNKDDKYDIGLLDTDKSIMAIQNTDFAQFHLRKYDDRADSYQKGVIIDNSNKYSIDTSFVDDNGKTLNIMNLVTTLADVVKEQQKQISELNAKVAYLELNK